MPRTVPEHGTAVQSSANHVLQRLSAELSTVFKLSEDRGASSNNTVKERRHKGLLLESLTTLCNPPCKPGARVPYFLQLRPSFPANRKGEDKQDSEQCKHCRERRRRTCALLVFCFVLFCCACGAALPPGSSGGCCPFAARLSEGRASSFVCSFLPKAE